MIRRAHIESTQYTSIQQQRLITLRENKNPRAAQKVVGYRVSWGRTCETTLPWLARKTKRRNHGQTGPTRG